MDDDQCGSLSEFYVACRSGDLNKVEYLLPRLSLYDLNQLESNGSTALHAAAFFGHINIVQLLMTHGGFLTTLRNRYNLTPAEESNDTIRRLLLLPDTIQLRFQNADSTTTTLFTPISLTSDTEDQSLIATTNEPIVQRPDWIDAYDNAHRIALENHEYMRKWLTKIPFAHIINMIKTDYLNQMNKVLTEDNFGLIQEYIALANDEDDARYLVYAYTTPTSFFKQINIDLAQRGSDFRFENNISKKYQDDEPPIGFGQYLFAAVIINHPSIDYWRYTGVTYRGMNISNDELNQYIYDARILTRSFLSTSKRIDTAFLYLQYNNPILRPVLCVYRVTQRHTSLAISDLSAIQCEDEVLIIPFVAFRVIKVDIDRFYVSDRCRVSVIFLDEVIMTEKSLEWISWQWNAEDLNIFCQLLFTRNNDRFNQHLPLGAMLLMTALFDLEQKPYERTLKDAFDQFLIVSINREWLIRFPIFIDYLIDGLNYLPLNIARTWIYHYFQTRVNIEHIRSVLNVLTNMISFFREIPTWIRNDDHEKYSLNVLQYQSRIDYIRDNENNDLFVIDRFLTTISIMDSTVLTSGFVRRSLFKFNIDIQQFSPVFLTVLIALYGGLHRFKRLSLDNKDTVIFSPLHMHRDSLNNSWLIDYMNANCWTHLPNTDEIEHRIHRISSEDDSPETIDLFTTWICLKGVKQPWIFHKYMSWSAFQRAIFRFHRLALYLSEFYYVKYDLELELEAPATFREDAISIMHQYTQSEKNETCSTFLHCVAVALTRLMIPGADF
ncbi:unnamed protein product [Rotaria sordida]|uniref:ANK_REP_REGION domain-containing protein n=1 Tax=Rotaria sordida TaxID=392033 RepID=A0A814UTW2_9BILA|nr:unnamed protein product [Rotaria sordida]